MKGWIMLRNWPEWPLNERVDPEKATILAVDPFRISSMERLNENTHAGRLRLPREAAILTRIKVGDDYFTVFDTPEEIAESAKLVDAAGEARLDVRVNVLRDRIDALQMKTAPGGVDDPRRMWKEINSLEARLAAVVDRITKLEKKQ